MTEVVVRAGLLHDMLEWSSVNGENLQEKFGQEVFALIKANSKNRDIEDKNKRRLDQLNKCLEIGDDALVVKIVDTIDSFKYYTSTNNEKELQRCHDWAKLLLGNLSQELKEKFGAELEQIINKKTG